MMSKVLITALLALFTFTYVENHFHYGHLREGNLRYLLRNVKNLPDSREIITDWITQKVDNFNPSNQATWQQVKSF